MNKSFSWLIGIMISVPLFGAKAETISFDRFDELSANNNVVILDVRTPREYDYGRIPRSINKNFFDDDFKDYVNQLDKTKEYIIYCRSGRRSTNAYPSFRNAGLKAYNFKPGILGWKKSGRSLVKD